MVNYYTENKFIKLELMHRLLDKMIYDVKGRMNNKLYASPSLTILDRMAAISRMTESNQSWINEWLISGCMF